MKSFLLLFLVVSTFNTYAAQIRNVALVFDFKNEKNTSYLPELRKEISKLSTYDIKLRQPKEHVYYNNSSQKNTLDILQKLYKNKNIHGILLMDFIGSSSVVSMKKFAKPTVAVNVLSAKAQGFRIKSNFNFIESSSIVSSNLDAVKKITGTKKVTIISSQGQALTKGRIKSYLDAEFSKKKMTYNVLRINSSNYMEKIPTIAEGETVFVSELLGFSSENFSEFIKQMNKRKLKTFSLSSKKHVEEGMLGSVFGDDLDYVHLTRLAGLNLQRMFLGDKASELTTKVLRSKKIVLNLDTAQLIGFTPSWDAIMNAVIIRKDVVSEELQLKEAVLAALKDNVDLKGANADYLASEAVRMKSINKYLPQVNLGASHQVIDKDSAKATSSLGVNPEKQTVGTVSVDQLILSDAAITNISISASSLRVSEQENVAFKNSLIKDVAIAYLNVLRAKLIADIQARNFRQTQLNLGLAKAKNSAGASRRTDVYRWESELATSKIQMINARVGFKKYYAELNRILNRPAESRYKLEDIDHLHPMFYLFRHVQKVPNNPLALEALRKFVISEAKMKSPIYLAAIENEDLVKKTVGLANRSFFMPEVGVNFNYNKSFSRSGIGSTAPVGTTINENSWGASLNVTLPLLAGGEKFSNRKEAVNKLVSATSKRRSLEFELDTFVSNQIDDLFSQLSAIELNKLNVKFSEDNFSAIKDLYKNGKVNIINVVDAQNNFLTASQNEVDSIYDFLSSYIELGNLIGQYDFLLDSTEQESMLNRLKSFYNK
ncbi:TolC family protein [Halobacteriovorax sp. HLS]|uniref:TolC family protein n=1 Tax=Halobacteriovorax sp. HLS TaxID=2234000 RepID=UPI000FD8734B|nr:TolC family protein [Halobacteriovorax sp. HLS]